jgi:NADPH:quinone reductase
VVGFWLVHCMSRPDMLREPLADLFERAARGALRPIVGGTYPLSEAARAHEDMQARRTTGKLLLDPGA